MAKKLLSKLERKDDLPVLPRIGDLEGLNHLRLSLSLSLFSSLRYKRLMKQLALVPSCPEARNS